MKARDSGEPRFDGKVAIITGSGGGLGASYARLLAARGAKVVVNDLGTNLDGHGHDSGPAARQVKLIASEGGDAVANFDDVTSEAGARRLVEQALATYGRLDIVINNAGNFLPDGLVEKTTSERFTKLWNVHVLGTVNVTRAAWRHLINQRYGRILNIGSGAGYWGAKGRYEYDTVKAAVHGFSKTLAIEGASHGINVNVLCPFARTRPLDLMVETSAPGLIPEQLLGAASSVELIAPMAIFLCHEQCKENGSSFQAIGGTFTRVVVTETRGYFNASPSVEDIRDNFSQITSVGDLAAASLIAPADSIQRASEMIEAFTSAASS